MSSSKSLWSREILFLFGATFLAYANISVFFFYYQYLSTLPIDPRWFGILIAGFSAVSLVMRPLIIPFLHRGNAYRTMFTGTIMLIAALCAYSLAMGFWGMLLVRSLHGLAFVLLGAALMTITVDHIPAERSAQFFGFLSIIVLIPNTMIPPLLPFLTQGLGGFTRVLLLFAGITALVFPLVHLARGSTPISGTGKPLGSLQKEEILGDLRNGLILCLLLSMLLLYSSYALVFFFLDGFGRRAGISGTGFFLTLSTAGEIGVRMVAGS
ncbi:MAG: MFS transporter, partial [Deltaproteobacteria bacterium]|nr:MFS transporter [Deltaproteobacteria bacterium]